jgi:hypothetical protein
VLTRNIYIILPCSSWPSYTHLGAKSCPSLCKTDSSLATPSEDATTDVGRLLRVECDCRRGFDWQSDLLNFQTTRDSTLQITVAHRDYCSQSLSSLCCLVTASNDAASTASVSNGSRPHWLAPLSCSPRAELAPICRTNSQSQIRSCVIIDGQ